MVKKKYVAGDIVWIEHRVASFLSPDGEKRRLEEAQIVEVNTSSAYAIEIKDKIKEKPYRYRIDLRTGKIKESNLFGNSMILWETKKQFDDDFEWQIELKKWRILVSEKAKTAISLKQLKAAGEILGINE